MKQPERNLAPISVKARKNSVNISDALTHRYIINPFQQVK